MCFASNPFVTSSGIPVTARWSALILSVRKNFYLNDLILIIVHCIAVEETDI
jgi:hypothetical protein